MFAKTLVCCRGDNKECPKGGGISLGEYGDEWRNSGLGKGDCPSLPGDLFGLYGVKEEDFLGVVSVSLEMLKSVIRRFFGPFSASSGLTFRHCVHTRFGELWFGTNDFPHLMQLSCIVEAVKLKQTGEISNMSGVFKEISQTPSKKFLIARVNTFMSFHVSFQIALKGEFLPAKNAFVWFISYNKERMD